MSKEPDFSKIKINLSEAKIFGNDAADEEVESLFVQYVIERPEIIPFLDPDNSLQIARAYKGEGKSALLRLVNQKLIAPETDRIVLSLIGSDIAPNISSSDQDLWTREWKKSILKVVASEIGSKIGIAFKDDAITLVEEAEANGFKKRNFVSSIADRLKVSSVGIERTRQQVIDYELILQRYISGRPLIWLIVDDIDQNFVNNEHDKLKVGTFFTACRQIASKIPELRIRLAIRPNIWTIVKREFEALSHVEQYIVDLVWNEDQYKSMLAARIKAYLVRTQQWALFSKNCSSNPSIIEFQLISLAFDSVMLWGGRKKSAHIVLFTLSRHRPRWMVELCKEAAKTALARSSTKIFLDDITKQLTKFGRKRIDDTVAEFKSQCPLIGEIISAFAGQPALFKTDELLQAINNRIMNAIHPTIIGKSGKIEPLDIAQFLFQIGFISARRDYGDQQYDHFTFSEKPNLLISRTNIDEGMKWEIHPTFRDVLNLRQPVQAKTKNPYA